MVWVKEVGKKNELKALLGPEIYRYGARIERVE